MTNDKKKTKIILLPGLDGTGLLFDPLLKECPEVFIPIVIKYPHDKYLSYDDLEAIIKSNIPGKEQFLILGESFSGPLAVRIAAKHPSNLLGVILAASFITSPIPPWMKVLPIKLLCRMPKSFFLMRYFMLDNVSGSDISETIKTIVDKVPSEVFAGRIEAVLNADESEALKQVNIPILYLRALNDRLVRRKNLDIIKRLKPDIQIADINAPHMLLQTRPEQAWEEIQKFTNNIKLDRKRA